MPRPSTPIRLRYPHETATGQKFVYYQEEEMFVGWLEEFPDYKTQGETIEELMDNLLDIYKDLTSGQIPCIHRIGELKVA